MSVAISTVYSQQPQKKVADMTKEEMMELTYDDLLTMSFEDLILTANKFGMSSDELLDYFLNKDVTAASKHSEKTLNSPLSSTVLSREEIQNSGATSIPEVLRLVPGMIVREKTPGNYDVHIRGNDNLPPKGMFVYSENSISLVMIDGRPVYNYAFGGTFWETLPIELNDIERIEVIRGPSSALYGPNAVSGAINIITRTVKEKKLHADGQVQIGTNNAKIGSASVSGGIEKLKVRVSGNFTHFDRFENDFYIFDRDQKYSADEMRKLRTYWLSSQRDTMFAEKNFDQVFPDPSLATNKYGGNAFLNYEVNNKIGMDLALGAQQSDVITSTLGNNNTSIVPRVSNTKYIDFRTHVYGFQAQANYMYGDQDIQQKYQGWHIAPAIFNSTLEYEQKFGTLIIRPGISYQTTTYDDSKWGDAALKDGFLNGPKTLSSFAYYLRADYKMFDKLRLIAAIRGDKYNSPNVTMPTYQFISSYDINSNNVVRASYSRANRGPFISDTYANYFWQVIPTYYTLHYEGNQNLKLPVMDMFELGYRSKVTKNIMVEVEAFHTKMKDIIFFTPDSMSINLDISPLMTGGNPTSNVTGHGQYQNLKMTSTQNGITMNVSVVVNSKLNFKVFGTIQKTTISNFYQRTIWNDFDYLTNVAGYKLMLDTADIFTKLRNGDNTPFSNPKRSYTASYKSFNDSSNVSMTNKTTPSFYGGLTINYTPMKKLNINTNFYFYSQQTMLHNKIDDIGKGLSENMTDVANYNAYGQYIYKNNDRYTDGYTIQAKITVNLKVSYKFWKENSVFVNCRNLLNNNKKEFAFLDKVGGMYLIGVNLNF